LLSNLYLNEVDRMLEKAKETTRNGKYTYVEYARYADDRAPRRRKGPGTGPDPDRHAAREMGVDPSGSGCRTRSQTT
jgi:hypothetical protein